MDNTTASSKIRAVSFPSLKLLVHLLNPFEPGFFFFVTSLKIGSFRLSTHRRDAHRKLKFWSNVLYLGRWALMG